MREYRQHLKGEPVTIRLVEDADDLAAFTAWTGTVAGPVGIDSETTGLGIYRPGWKLRLVQLASATEAWVLPVERGDAVRAAADEAISRLGPRLVAHNATYDALALDRGGIGDGPNLVRVMGDTRTLAHLIDPRSASEGGTGHGLKALAAAHVDPDAPDGEKALKDAFRKFGWHRDTGWAHIAIDHPDYVTYAGLDAILTARLAAILGPVVKARHLGKLYEFERQAAAVCAEMERRGFLLDVAYTQDLIGRFHDAEDEALRQAGRWGIENVNSPKMVAETLTALGAVLTETTATGQPKVDRAVLTALADEDSPAGWAAGAILDAKQAAKFRTAYAEAMLEARDAADRIHPRINPLQARTARMSVAEPPLQQLPSKDATIRKCLVADPGHLIVAADYSQVELRVLAAAADEAAMKAAFAAGEDIHDATARAVFGDGFTAAQRKLAKGVNFGRVYGGGARTLARQTGITEDEARRVIAAYDERFPGVKRYARQLQVATNDGALPVETLSGRLLPLDRSRGYAATNYVVQSTSADVLKAALVRLHDAGLGGHLLLPVHDEVIAQAPAAEADEVAAEIGRVMDTDLLGVSLPAEAEVYGPSWGSGYE